MPFLLLLLGSKLVYGGAEKEERGRLRKKDSGMEKLSDFAYEYLTLCEFILENYACFLTFDFNNLFEFIRSWIYLMK